MKQAWIAWILLGMSTSSVAAPNVILITIDGVRYEEMFKKPGIIPKLRSRVASHKALGFKKVRIANPVGISLPGYMSILSGEFERKCKLNTCKNTSHSTFFDGLIDRYGFNPNELATIASWRNIGDAIELNPGRIYRDIGVQSDDQNDLPPWHGSRWDFRTFEHAQKYLIEKKPRALFLSFVDTDEYAHQHQYKKYVNAINEFDDRLENLIQLLESMGEYGDETSIVITTDHGRGHGFLYYMHGSQIGGAGHAWAFIIPSPKLLREGMIQRTKKQKFSHRQIRPTLESLLGLKPIQGKPLID